MEQHSDKEEAMKIALQIKELFEKRGIMIPPEEKANPKEIDFMESRINEA